MVSAFLGVQIPRQTPNCAVFFSLKVGGSLPAARLVLRRVPLVATRLPGVVLRVSDARLVSFVRQSHCASLLAAAVVPLSCCGHVDQADVLADGDQAARGDAHQVLPGVRRGPQTAQTDDESTCGCSSIDLLLTFAARSSCTARPLLARKNRTTTVSDINRQWHTRARRIAFACWLIDSCSLSLLCLAASIRLSSCCACLQASSMRVSWRSSRSASTPKRMSSRKSRVRRATTEARLAKEPAACGRRRGIELTRTLGSGVVSSCLVVIFGKLDKNQDGLIDLREWVSVLFDLFRFMSANAFHDHCHSLLALCGKADANTAKGE